MLKFNKIFNPKLISLILICAFLLTNTAYGIDLSKGSCLRKPLDFNDKNGAEKRYGELRASIIARSVKNSEKDPDISKVEKLKKPEFSKSLDEWLLPNSSLSSGGQMFWLRDSIWLIGAKLMPKIFVNRNKFNVHYGVTIAPWFENGLIYAVSLTLGGNLLIAWGLFAAGHVVDSILNLVRLKSNRAPPINLLNAGIIALINAYICIIPSDIFLTLFLTWLSHQTINLIAGPSLIRNRLVRAAIIPMALLPVFGHYEYVLKPRVYYPSFKESVLLEYLGIPKEQQTLEILSAIKTVNNANTDLPYGKYRFLHRWETGYSLFRVKDLEHAWRLKGNFRSCEIIEDVFKKHGININDYSLARYSMPNPSAETVARDFKDLKLRLLGALNELLDMPDLYAHVPADSYRLDMEHKALLEEIKSSLQLGRTVDEKLKRRVNKAILTDIFSLALTPWGQWNYPVEENPGKKNEMLLESLEYFRKITGGQLSLASLKNEPSVMNFMNEIRRIPPEIIKSCVESANAHNLPPSLLIASAIAYPNYVFNNPYQLDKGIDILWKRNVIPGTVRDALVYVFSKTGANKIIIDNQTRDFGGGVLFNGKMTMGLMGIRPAWVREYDGWKRFSIDSYGMNDQEISWRLLEPKLNIEALAAMWEKAALEVVDIIKNARRGIKPVLDERHIREAGKAELEMGKYPPLTVEYYSSLPLEELERSDYWILAQFHPIRYHRLRPFIDIQGFVIESGVLNGENAAKKELQIKPGSQKGSSSIRQDRSGSPNAASSEIKGIFPKKQNILSSFI